MSFSEEQIQEKIRQENNARYRDYYARNREKVQAQHREYRRRKAIEKLQTEAKESADER